MDNLTGKTIHHYSYYFNDGSAVRDKGNRFDFNKYQVLLESETEVVFIHHGFQVIKKECDRCLGLNSPRVVIDVSDKTWGNSVIFDLYSTTELTTDAVKVIIINEIKQKLKFLGVTSLGSIEHKINEVVLWTTQLKWI